MLKKYSLSFAICMSMVARMTFAQVAPPSAATGISTFDMAPDNIGRVQNSVNLFSGDLNLPFSLVTLAGKDGFGVNVAITYNSNIQTQVDKWNLDAPTGILGLGWSLDIPKIVCDHKSTGTREDDTFYLQEGQTNNQLVRTGSGSDNIGSYHSYALKKYQFWQIRFYYDGADYTQLGTPTSGSNKWVIIKENGFSYIYGDNNSGRNTIQYTVRWNNWIGSSSNTSGQSQLATTWNLSEVDNLWGEKITYQYTNVEQFVGSATGKKQTEASYLSQIVDPIGRKIQFVYNNKSSQFFMEPHTEMAEPDGYQEYYERQYLDHINVLQETGVQYLSINFRYTSINDVSGSTTAKMLLSYIERRNGQNQALPGMHFDYYTSTGTSGYKGFLQKITYPTGGTVTYSYIMNNNTIGHSNRAFTIQAPMADANSTFGYAEPNVWFGPDYVVVAWRAIAGYLYTRDTNGNILSTTYNHSTGPMPVRLLVYQWTGEWVAQDLTTIQNVSATFTTDVSQVTEASNYKDFQVVTEKDFFAVLSHPIDTHYDFNLFYKSTSYRGKWVARGLETIDFGAPDPSASLNIPKLSSGDNFVLLGSALNSANHQSYIYTYNRNGNNGFSVSSFQVVPFTNYNYYTATNNYFVCFTDQNSSTTSVGPKMSLYYLSEEGVWAQVILTSAFTYAGWIYNGTHADSYWYSSNSFALAMAGNNPEYLYRWDVNYSNFVRDNGAGSLLGNWEDVSYVFPIENSSFGLVDDNVRGQSVRFDGASWLPSYIHSTPAASQQYGSYGPINIGIGSDFVVCSDDPNHNSNGQRSFSTFDPNIYTWTYAAQAGTSFHPYVSNNIFLDVGNNTGYYRMPDGTWNLMGSALGYLLDDCLVSGLATYTITNGGYTTLTGDHVGTQYTFYNYVNQFGVWSVANLHSNNMMASFTLPTTIDGPTYRDANSLNLYFDVQGHLLGNQIDYPVGSITISGTNSTDQNIAFGYNFTTATVDPTGTIAEYAEANVIPGSTTSTSYPNGYTKTYFNNGLSNADDNGIPFSGSIDLHWVGMPYQINTYDNGNIQRTSSTTSYQVTSLVLNNSMSTQVDMAFAVRPSSDVVVKDGISKTTIYTFDLPSSGSPPTGSGLIRSQLTYATSNTGDSEEVDYTYGFDVNSAMFSTIHLFTPAAQLTRKKNGAIVQSKVTRYKAWAANNLGLSGTAPAAFDELIWNGTNSSTFNSWDPATYPSSTLTDWTMNQQVTLRDNYTGTPLEILTTGNTPSAVLLDQYKIREVAQVSNATYNQVAYTSFEDAATGNWNSVTRVPGNAKTGNNYYDFSTGALTLSNLLSTENYVLSFWAMSSGGALSISGQSNLTVNSPSNWTYFEYAITNLPSLAINRSGITPVFVDEVRFYPKRAAMTSSTFDLVYGQTSVNDNNNRVIYTQYDSWGRTQTVLDENKSIITSKTYNQKK